MTRAIPSLLMLMLLAPSVAAKWQLGDLYPDRELRHWQGRYPKSIHWNFDNLVLGRLTPAERQRVGPVALDLPLRAPGEARNHPLQFFASGRTITVPILSVRFLDELTQAWGYLWSNGLDLQLVGDYMAMLKYRDPTLFPGQRFPGPLEALGIAKDAWKSDPRMDDVSQKALKSSVVWILAHELGHIYYRHPGYGPGVERAQAQANEAEADRFANMIMRRIGVAPLGMVQFFMAMAHLDPGRGDFSNDAAWQDYLRTQATHPLTAARLNAMASDLRRSPGDFTTAETDQRAAVQRIEFVAGQIELIGNTLEDPQMHRLIAATGLATDLNSLRNRRRQINPVDPDNPCAGRRAASDFAGRHQGLYTRNLKDGRTEWLAAWMSLERDQNRVRGRFSFGAGEGEIRAVVSADDQLLFDWRWADAAGKGRLTRDATGALSGEWGNGGNAAGGGSWVLCRE
jgi:hypothetical protein